MTTTAILSMMVVVEKEEEVVLCLSGSGSETRDVEPGTVGLFYHAKKGLNKHFKCLIDFCLYFLTHFFPLQVSLEMLKFITGLCNL